jgi:hypothetical protein
MNTTLLRSNHLYVLGLILLVCAMPLSMFMMSIAQFVLAASFLFEGSVVEKVKRFFQNKAALIIAGILFLHLIGMLWTDNTAEGWKDIRIKIPLFAITVMLAGSQPLAKKQFHLVLGFFISAVFAGSIISMLVLTGIIHRELHDIREIFIFHISHIRFALFTCLAIFSLLYFLFREKYSSGNILKIFFSLIALWLFIFLFIMESVTGVVIVTVITTLLLLYKAARIQNAITKISLAASAVLIPCAIFFVIKNISDESNAVKNLPVNIEDKTPDGNKYSFQLSEQDRENGYLVWNYVCEDELRKEWNTRSIIKYDSLDKRDQQLKQTLIRFLASKGWRKDGDAVRKLSNEEVHSVEKGIANINYQNISSMRSRVLEIAWEFRRVMEGEKPSGHSVIQRFEFWRAASGIIKENIFIGVGTGDMPLEYHRQYLKMNSPLDWKHRLRAHNQYLAITVAFGFIGLLYFIFALLAPMFITKRYSDYFYLTFLIIALLSMLSEDTLETQAGATFFAFFNAFFLFAKPDEEK